MGPNSPQTGYYASPDRAAAAPASVHFAAFLHGAGFAADDHHASALDVAPRGGHDVDGAADLDPGSASAAPYGSLAASHHSRHDAPIVLLILSHNN